MGLQLPGNVFALSPDKVGAWRDSTCLMDLQLPGNVFALSPDKVGAWHAMRFRSGVEATFMARVRSSYEGLEPPPGAMNRATTAIHMLSKAAQEKRNLNSYEKFQVKPTAHPISKTMVQ